jgi:Tetratricopeptide repeat
VSVHRLVQSVTADQMPAELASQWRQAAAALIEAAIPEDTEPPGTWLVCAALLPHAQAVLDLTSDGMWRIARYLGISGSYPAAHDLFQLIVDAYEEDDAYGPEHPDTLAVRGNLARWTGQAGDTAAARDQFAALLPVRERVLGAEHPHTLVSRHNLARWTGQAGDPAAACDLFTALLPVLEQIPGPEHPRILDLRPDLARWTGGAGDPASARDQLSALLPVIIRVLGPEHPDTPAARHELSLWTARADSAPSAPP